MHQGFTFNQQVYDSLWVTYVVLRVQPECCKFGVFSYKVFDRILEKRNDRFQSRAIRRRLHIQDNFGLYILFLSDRQGVLR